MAVSSPPAFARQAMRFSRWVFTAASLYGALTLIPLYFAGNLIAASAPPAPTHVEFFYGFIGVALAWQLMFWLIARDPLRFRPAMVPAILEKIGFGGACVALFIDRRLAASGLAMGIVDLGFCLLFVVAFIRTAPGRIGT